MWEKRAEKALGYSGWRCGWGTALMSPETAVNAAPKMSAKLAP